MVVSFYHVLLSKKVINVYQFINNAANQPL